MKKRIQILLTMVLLFSLSYQSIIGQTTDQKKKNKDHITWVTLIDNSPKVKGYLRNVGDSLMIISNLSNYESQSIPINNIKEIKFRPKGSVEKGILFGALGGFAVGGLLGLASGGSSKGCYFLCFTAGEVALITGATLGVTGALVGGLLGSAKIKIPINGRVKNQKEELLKYKIPY